MKPWEYVRPPSNAELNGNLEIIDTVSGKAYFPIEDNRLRMYVCGITPYDSAHLGHIFTYLIFDIVNRLALSLGAKVEYVQNVTDIDDPLFDRARKTGVSWEEIANNQIDNFKQSMEFLEIIPPQAYVLVTEEIDTILDDIKKFESDLYQAGDNYYFKSNISQLKTFTGLEDRELIEISDQRGGDSRHSGKIHPVDPKLWVKSQIDEPSWQSDFGDGRPGWHIECVSIANKYLGTSFDLQGGGADLVYPHHAFCDQLARLIFQKPLARGYMHTALVSYQGEKMSKSLGNLVFLKDLTDRGYSASEIRLALLLQDWRSPWEFQFEIMSSAKQMLGLWKTAYQQKKFPKVETVKDIIVRNLASNLSINQALREIDESIKQASDCAEGNQAAEYIDAVFGIQVDSTRLAG